MEQLALAGGLHYPSVRMRKLDCLGWGAVGLLTVLVPLSLVLHIASCAQCALGLPQAARPPVRQMAPVRSVPALPPRPWERPQKSCAPQLSARRPRPLVAQTIVTAPSIL